MPIISTFYGIVIRMYFLQSEHNPPHIHAIYNDDVAAIDFQTGVVIDCVNMRRIMLALQKIHPDDNAIES